jgi:hypothetical protein
MLRAFGAVVAGMPRVGINKAAAPATRAAEKVRLSIVTADCPLRNAVRGIISALTVAA